MAVTIIFVCICSVAMAASILVKDGSRGAPVRRVQSLLIDQGYLTGEADGVCGPHTVAAIRKFQAANGLDVDGVCGNGTYQVLSGGETYVPDGESSDVSSNSRDNSRVLFVSATAYSAQDPGNSTHTAAGTLVRHGVIAVDPNVIPMGTRVFIPGYGEAVAEDTGGSIKGNHIDIAFDTHKEALTFGRKNLEVYIME